MARAWRERGASVADWMVLSHIKRATPANKQNLFDFACSKSFHRGRCDVCFGLGHASTSGNCITPCTVVLKTRATSPLERLVMVCGHALCKDLKSRAHTDKLAIYIWCSGRVPARQPGTAASLRSPGQHYPAQRPVECDNVSKDRLGECYPYDSESSAPPRPDSDRP